MVLAHDLGPNWELVSDAINSTLQFKVSLFNVDDLIYILNCDFISTKFVPFNLLLFCQLNRIIIFLFM